MRQFLLALFLAVTSFCWAQDYAPFQTVTTALHQFSAIRDSAQQAQKIGSWLASLQQRHQVPFVCEDSVLFLYWGNAKSVSWMGDFNGWGRDEKFRNKGTRVANTSLWFLKAAFPVDARLDYKLVLNGMDYILDPYGTYQQWSGVGGGSPNSELRMPRWQEDPELHERNDVPRGQVIHDRLLTSRVLGYQVTFNVYLPAGIDGLGKLPVIYVTDGYEYLLPQLGNMATLLDNLIADKKIKPIVAVFVDHREPVNRSNNKRMQELSMNKAYLDFFTTELIPEIEKNYPVMAVPGQRAILGSSMGGLTATYFAFARPDVFGMAGIQSPSFWSKPQIYQLCNSTANPKMKISMTAGLIHDTSVESRKMKEILATNACEYHYREVNQGHSWGNWRNLVSDILIDFFGSK